MVHRVDLQQHDPATLVTACREWGFFRLVGHGLIPQLKTAALEATRAFFEQPRERKNQIRRTDVNCWGFYDAELTKNRQDRKEILDIGPDMDSGPLAGARTQWPDDAHFQNVVGALNDTLHVIALEVVRQITATLDTGFDPAPVFADHSSFLRLNYYPVSENPAPADTDWLPAEGELGIHHHTDAGAVTVLMHDGVSGLQVRKDDAWHLIQAEPDELIINIGDIVQVWSNDLYKAPLHRVLASRDQARISVPYFLNPDYAYSYAPLNVPQPNYRPINWGEFRALRSQGDYADVGEEVQIARYRI